MVDLSNKTLAVVLLATMVVSLGGTFFVLSGLGDVSTGFAANSQGVVNLSVLNTISITTNESSLVNFGTCSLNESGAIYLNSMNTENNTQYCGATGNLPNNISVRNDGNVVVNVTINSNNCSPGAGNVSCLFLNYSTATSTSENGLFQYQTSSNGRYGYTGGCGVPNNTWIAFSDTGMNYIACYNLATHLTANSFVTDFRLRLPKGLPIGTRAATITYTAFIG